MAASTVTATNRTTVALLGVTGDGKSTLGNVLVTGSSASRGPFQVGAGLDSQTREAKLSNVDIGDLKLSIIDVPGFADTGMSPEQVLDTFEGFADLAPDGIDAFLFVVRTGRFKPEHDQALQAFENECTRRALNHTALIFSHCDSPEELKAGVEGLEEGNSLRKWLPKVPAYTGLDNVDGNAAANQQTLAEVVRKVLAENEDPYSNEPLEQARKWRTKQLKLADRLRPELSSAMNLVIASVRSGTLSREKADEAIVQILKGRIPQWVRHLASGLGSGLRTSAMAAGWTALLLC